MRHLRCKFDVLIYKNTNIINKSHKKGGDIRSFVGVVFTFFSENQSIKFFWNGRQLFGYEILRTNKRDGIDFYDLSNF